MDIDKIAKLAGHAAIGVLNLTDATIYAQNLAMALELVDFEHNKFVNIFLAEYL